MKERYPRKYSDKLERLEKTASLEKTDRVPLAAATIYFPAKFSDISYEDMFFEHESYTEAAKNFADEFDWDAVCFLRTFESVTLGLSLAGESPSTAINVAISSVLGGGFTADILSDVYSSHPGRELAANEEGQFTIEDTLMDDDEYDKFIEDPMGFLSREIVPRAYENLQDPTSAGAKTALIELGKEINNNLPEVMEFYKEMVEYDCPPWYCALAPNPLDFLGAFIRNFDKLLKDLYRYPNQIKELCEILTPILTKVGLETGKISAELTGSKRIFCPVWYNTYLSPEMYEEFHWNYLKQMAEEFIEEGFTPLFSFQGEHEHHLESILDLPAGEAIAWFDKTDLGKAKEVVGEHSCIAGGINPSLLISGSEGKVGKEVEDIIKEMKNCEGFIFTLPFNAIGDAKIKNVKKMTETVFAKGKY